MGALDHRAARAPAPPIGARNTEDPYTVDKTALYRQSFISERSGDELVLRGSAANAGKSGKIAIALEGIAHTLARRSLDMKLAILGIDSPEAITYMVDQTVIMGQKGYWMEISGMELIILDYRRERLGPFHESTLLAMLYLGATKELEGLYNESAALASYVVKERTKTLGEAHLDTILALQVLSSAWMGLGRFVEAEAVQRRVFEARTHSLGRHHKETIEALQNLATILESLKRYDEAEAIELEALDVRGTTFGSEDPDTIASMGRVAAIWYSQGRYEEAEATQSQVRAYYNKALGPHHPFTLAVAAHLAAIWYQLQRYEEAEAAEVEVLEYRRKYWAGHPSTITATYNLAMSRCALGRRAEALELMNEVIMLEQECATDGYLPTNHANEMLERWREEEVERKRSDAEDTLEFLDLYTDDAAM